MIGMSRRRFLAVATAASAASTLPRIAASPAGRRVVTLVYDKALGAMRLIDRAVR